jgi:ABC-type Fe3+/spermidine/putrescine transport system ATPase subunit
MNVALKHLRKSFGTGDPAVDDVSFRIEPGEMFFLLGPSGCGKTTVLRMVAGFVAPDAGDILFDGRRMNDVPAQHRQTAMVFQSYAIWPHLTVYENVAYGLRVQKISGAELDGHVRDALRLARLETLAPRKPAQLSGGEQQRVALARALAVRPGLILLDEPLSNLDARLRLDLREELRRIHLETKVTCLYVTHDQDEALSLADRLAVMNRGRIEQIGTPREVYERPASEFVARFMGETNWLAPGSTLAAQFQVPPDRSACFRPEAAILAADGIPATVQRTVYLGHWTELQVETAAGEKLTLVTRDEVAVGKTVRFRLRREDLIVF